MLTVRNIIMPIHVPEGKGFFNVAQQDLMRLGAFELRLLSDDPYRYLVLYDVPMERIEETVQEVRSALRWASLRFGFGIRTSDSPVRHEEGLIDGQFPTTFNGPVRNPMRVSGSLRSQEGDTRLFYYLGEGHKILNDPARKMDPILDLALQVFASVDFEVTENAKFLALTSIIEILAKPLPRPSICTVMIDDMLGSLEQQLAAADDEARQALTDMKKSAVHWKRESIRSSVRRLGIRVATAVGSEDPVAAGSLAVKLYDKRSTLTHEAKPVSGTDLLTLHQLVRKAIAVEAGRADVFAAKM